MENGYSTNFEVSFIHIQNTRFPLINDVKYDSLTDFEHKTTLNSIMPFSTNITDFIDRKSLIYICTFVR